VSDYYAFDKVQYKETQALVQNLYHYLINLAASLKGKISSEEEDTLAHLFQVHMDLQMLLDEMSLRVSSPPPSSPSPDQDEAQKIAHAQAMQYARDLITAMRQKREQQRRLELTSQQLIRAEKLATVGHIAASVAHELGNIFTPLLMYAKLIQKETMGDPNSEVAEYAGHIAEVANRASDMLRQLVDASRNEPARMVPLTLPAIIQDTFMLFAPRIKKQRINVAQHYPDDLPQVIGRPDQMEQVFINMALNAFDAMPDGGDYTVTLKIGDEKSNGHSKGRQPDDPQVDGYQIDDTDFVTVYIQDTGEGILPENVSLLFEPFFTTKAKGAGSGLGLFVTHLIINQHGGAIEVESELGKGTTFIIKLPAVTQQEKIYVD
jgi:signal transduction histidine kinase